jgi:plasmid stability protein
VRTESHGRIEQTEFPLREILKNGLSARSEEVGFESIVAAIEELLSYGIGDGPLIQSFTELRAPVRDAARVEVLFGAYEAVIRAILKAFLDGQPKTELQVAAHDSLSAFIRRLGSALRIVLVTLNYDTLLDDALDWCDGFVDTTRDYAEFDPLRWHDRIASDHLLLHVHGSVRFGMRPSTMSGLDVPFGEAVRYATQTLAMRSLRNASSPYADGQLLSASPIIAGGHKSPKLMLNSRPYAYYNASALEAMSYADGLLILGYGFGDAHVNAWIEEYLRLRRRKKLAIVGYRTGKDIGDNLTPTEVFLRKLARRDQHDIYVPVEGGSPPRALHGLIGDAYFVATGVPVSADAEEAVVQYLLAERL